MKVAIIGSRTFLDYNFLEETLLKVKDRITEIVSGGAKGADSLAEKFANKYNIPTKIFLPDWDTYKKAAGFIRNTQIIEYCDVVVAFWDGKSRGTMDSVKKAEKLGKKVKIIRF